MWTSLWLKNWNIALELKKPAIISTLPLNIVRSVNNWDSSLSLWLTNRNLALELEKPAGHPPFKISSYRLGHWYVLWAPKIIITELQEYLQQSDLLSQCRWATDIYIQIYYGLIALFCREYWKMSSQKTAAVTGGAQGIGKAICKVKLSLYSS